MINIEKSFRGVVGMQDTGGMDSVENEGQLCAPLRVPVNVNSRIF